MEKVYLVNYRKEWEVIRITVRKGKHFEVARKKCYKIIADWIVRSGKLDEWYQREKGCTHERQHEKRETEPWSSAIHREDLRSSSKARN
jgi:hypothetical protein